MGKKVILHGVDMVNGRKGQIPKEILTQGQKPKFDEIWTKN